MSWLGTNFTAIGTAAIGSVVSWFLAGMAVRWYRISAFEGGSSYFVVGIALCGLVAGFIIGLVIARIVAASAHPSLVTALLYSALAMLGVEGLIGGTARVLADIPPTIDGESLMLQVEVRWPTSRTESPANTPGVAYLDLGSKTLLRKQEAKRGALWKEDAQKIDGQWTVIGAAPLSTSRGTPVIDVTLNSTEHVSFTLPSLSHPTAADSTWTMWYPTEGKGGPARTDDVTYRYRVQKFSAPVRTEHLGNFAVSAVVSYFKPVDTEGMSTIDFYGTFRMTFRDKPLATAGALKGDDSATPASSVAVLPGTQTLLLAAVNGEWMLLGDENGTLRAQHITEGTRTHPAELTNDPTRMAETRRPQDPRGRVDRTTYSRSHMLLFDHAVLNVDTREVHRFTAQSEASLVPSVPPLGVSPGAQSFARFVMGRPGNVGNFVPMLAVTDFVRDTVYELPIDRPRMRYGVLDDLNTEWLAHHFTWKRDATGVERLEARTDFVPVPYRGVFLTGTNGQSTYQFANGGQPVRQVLVEFLKAEFHATGDTSSENEYEYVLHIGGDPIKVETPGNKDSYVRLSRNDGGPGNDLVVRIGSAFNAVLATGKYDKAFAQP